MTCNMLRVHSGRLLLGRQLLPSGAAASLRSPAAASHGLCAIATRRSTGWNPLPRLSITPTAVATLLSRCRSYSSASASASASWTCAGRQFGSTASLALQGKNAVSRRYASASETGGGSGNLGGGGAGGGRGGGGGGGGGGGRGGGSGAGDEGIRRIWVWYLGLLDTNPIITKAVTSGILTFIGDVVSQFSLEKAEKLDGQRTAVMTFLGFALVGPTLHFWYSTLSKLVTVGPPTGIAIRLVLDQLCFTPPFIALFMSSLMTLEGKQEQVVAKLKQDWPSVVVANWLVWVPAQILNFWLVPLKLQVACANFTALFWNAYLSWKSHVVLAPLPEVTAEAKT